MCTNCLCLLWTSISTMLLLLLLLLVLVCLCTFIWWIKGGMGRVPMHLGVSLTLGVQMSAVHSQRYLGRLVIPLRIIQPTCWVVLLSMFKTCPPTPAPLSYPFFTPPVSYPTSHSHLHHCHFHSLDHTWESTLWIVRWHDTLKTHQLIVIADSDIYPTHAQCQER